MAAFPIDWSKTMTKRSGQYVVGRRNQLIKFDSVEFDADLVLQPASFVRFPGRGV